jgi:hypothetical protein
MKGLFHTLGLHQFTFGLSNTNPTEGQEEAAADCFERKSDDAFHVNFGYPAANMTNEDSTRE